MPTCKRSPRSSPLHPSPATAHHSASSLPPPHPHPTSIPTIQPPTGEAGPTSNSEAICFSLLLWHNFLHNSLLCTTFAPQFAQLYTHIRQTFNSRQRAETEQRTSRHETNFFDNGTKTASLMEQRQWNKEQRTRNKDYLVSSATSVGTFESFVLCLCSIVKDDTYKSFVLTPLTKRSLLLTPLAKRGPHKPVGEMGCLKRSLLLTPLSNNTSPCNNGSPRSVPAAGLPSPRS